MKPFVGVIGGRNSGKSTLIGSLTGCPTRTYRGIVEDRQTNQKIYVIASSPQEKELDPKELDRVLRQTLNDDKILGIIMAIQPTHPRTRLSIEGIFHKVKRTARFRITPVVLNPPYEESGSVDVGEVRRRLEPMGLKPCILNGRRFAHFNAYKVRKLASLPR